MTPLRPKVLDSRSLGTLATGSVCTGIVAVN
jgi:hypothetical protein